DLHAEAPALRHPGARLPAAARRGPLRPDDRGGQAARGPPLAGACRAARDRLRRRAPRGRRDPGRLRRRAPARRLRTAPAVVARARGARRGAHRAAAGAVRVAVSADEVARWLARARWRTGPQVDAAGLATRLAAALARAPEPLKA